MYVVFKTKHFLKAFIKIKKSGALKPDVVDAIEQTIHTLSHNKKLSQKHKDHALRGKMKEYRECHVRPDVLLVYQKQDDKLVLVLINIGSHSELFK